MTKAEHLAVLRPWVEYASELCRENDRLRELVEFSEFRCWEDDNEHESENIKRHQFCHFCLANRSDGHADDCRAFTPKGEVK